MRDNGKGGIVTCINVIRFVYKSVIGKLKERGYVGEIDADFKINIEACFT
jgi:hypothetical protein